MNLSTISSNPPADFNRSLAKKEIKALQKRMRELQYVMRAQEKYSLLIVFQGMDASGKDGAVKDVFKGISPGDIKVKSWKAPTKEELAHDFLWRIHQHTPQKGMIQVFNRSHYEDVLITRVHNWCDDALAEKRFKAINQFEEQLWEHNNTKVLKFYLHISKNEQEVRLTERKTLERKFWKHNDGDWEERKKWDIYMKMYEEVFEKSTLPWTIVSANDNRYKAYTILKKVIETLESLPLTFPPLESS